MAVKKLNLSDGSFLTRGWTRLYGRKEAEFDR